MLNTTYGDRHQYNIGQISYLLEPENQLSVDIQSLSREFGNLTSGRVVWRISGLISVSVTRTCKIFIKVKKKYFIPEFLSQIQEYLTGIIVCVLPYITADDQQIDLERWTLNLHNVHCQFSLSHSEQAHINYLKNNFADFTTFISENNLHIEELIGECNRLHIQLYERHIVKKCCAILRINTRCCTLIVKSISHITELSKQLYLLLDEVSRQNNLLS